MSQKLLALLICLTTVPAFADDIVIDTKMNIDTYRVFGSEHPGIYKHPASITELDNGDLYIAYYGGAGEYDSETAVYGSRQKKGQLSWSPPEVIADTPFRGDGNPVVWQAPDGVVWLFYVNLYGKTWSEARVKGKISTDGAKTWSDSFMLTMEIGTMARGKPIVLMNGDYLLPMYYETGEDREHTASDTASFFLRYNPKTKVWTENQSHSFAQWQLTAPSYSTRRKKPGLLHPPRWRIRFKDERLCDAVRIARRWLHLERC